MYDVFVARLVGDAYAIRGDAVDVLADRHPGKVVLPRLLDGVVDPCVVWRDDLDLYLRSEGCGAIVVVSGGEGGERIGRHAGLYPLVVKVDVNNRMNVSPWPDFGAEIRKFPGNPEG